MVFGLLLSTLFSTGQCFNDVCESATELFPCEPATNLSQECSTNFTPSFDYVCESQENNIWPTIQFDQWFKVKIEEECLYDIHVINYLQKSIRVNMFYGESCDSLEFVLRALWACNTGIICDAYDCGPDTCSWFSFYNTPLPVSGICLPSGYTFSNALQESSYHIQTVLPIGTYWFQVYPVNSSGSNSFFDTSGTIEICSPCEICEPNCQFTFLNLQDENQEDSISSPTLVKTYKIMHPIYGFLIVHSNGKIYNSLMQEMDISIIL